MSDLNDLKLYGRIVKDAIIKTKNDKQIAYFTIAVNKTKKDATGKYNDEANYFFISTFISSDKFASHLKKGQPLIIEGELTQKTKEVGTDANGQRLFDSRIYITTKKIHLIFTAKKEVVNQNENFEIPEDIIIESDMSSDDIIIDEPPEFMF